MTWVSPHLPIRSRRRRPPPHKMAVSRALSVLRVFLARIWLHLCRSLLSLARIQPMRPTNEFFHKVVIIGDDFAAGLGDYVTLGSSAGLAEYLKPLVNRSEKVRHQWEIVNAGVANSLSDHWLVNSPAQCYDNVFGTSAIGDAEIVVILLGSNELRLDPSKNSTQICKNLISICDTLRKKGKRVCLGTVASPAPLEQEAEKLPLNSMLEEYCASTKGEGEPVVLGPRLDTFAFRRQEALTHDNFHFNSTAYKMLARNSSDFLIPMMTAIEWKTWKNELHPVSYDKTLYE